MRLAYTDAFDNAIKIRALYIAALLIDTRDLGISVLFLESVIGRSTVTRFDPSRPALRFYHR